MKRLPDNKIIIVFVIVFFTGILYMPVINADFVNFDDTLYVTQNRLVQKGLTIENIMWAFKYTEKTKTYWHPLTWLSHMLDCHLFGLDPAFHHLHSLILHIGNALLLFLLINNMTSKLWPSAFVALLFAIHPINVESVAWVAERKNVLSTFFFLLTLLLYVNYTNNGQWSKIKYVVSLICFALALMSKAMVITIPFILILLDYWPLKRFNIQIQRKPIKVLFTGNRTSIARLIIEKLPYTLLAGLSAYIVTKSLNFYHQFKPIEAVSLDLRIGNALITYIMYIFKTFWPNNLAHLYPFPASIPYWKVTTAAILIMIISLIGLRLYKRRPFIMIGWLWYLGTLLPVIGIVQAGLWPAMADRWAYIPLIGIFFIIIWSFYDIINRLRLKRSIILAITVPPILVISLATSAQVKVWNNSFELLQHTVNITDNNFGVHNDFGIALSKKGKFNEAFRHYKESLRINPKYALAHNNLGIALVRREQLPEAVYHFNSAVRLKPNYIDAYFNLARTHMMLKEIDLAISNYKKAIELSPYDAEIHHRLSIAFFQKGDLQQCEYHLIRAVDLKPDYRDAHENLAYLKQIKK